MNILFVADNKKGTGFYRMMMPANEIRKANLAGVRLVFAAEQADVEWADIVVVQMPYHQSMFELFDWAKSIGKVMVYEIDDYLQGIDPSNPSYRIWNSTGPHLQRAMALLEKADAVTVSTDRLQREYAPWNSKIYVIPNFLEKTLFPDKLPVKKSKTITIGYTGAASHQKDLELVDDVITKFCQNHPEVTLKLFGIEPEKAFKKIPRYDGKWNGTKIKHQLEVIKGCDITNYFHKLSMQEFDIGIAPLVDNSFNSCKSDLKIKEYGSLGIPVVASDVYPYRKIVQNGKNGFLAGSADEWYKSLEILVKDVKKRKEMGKNNLQMVDKEAWIHDNVAIWVNTYQTIYNNMLRAAGVMPQ